MYNGYEDVEIYVPKKEYIPTEEDIYADGWNEEQFRRDSDNPYSMVLEPCAPRRNETEEECDKQNAILQERYKRALGFYWGNNKYARRILQSSRISK